MSISLIDVWYFLINFNLLALIPILIIGLISFAVGFDSEPSNFLITNIIFSVFLFSFLYIGSILILDEWLNWIDMPGSQIIDVLNEVLLKMRTRN